jgi:hypothetical protein
MKSAVLVILILCGTLLLAGPALMDYFRDSGDLMLSSGNRLAFWLAGSLMILGGIIGGVAGMWRQPHLTK